MPNQRRNPKTTNPSKHNSNDNDDEVKQELTETKDRLYPSLTDEELITDDEETSFTTATETATKARKNKPKSCSTISTPDRIEKSTDQNAQKSCKKPISQSFRKWCWHIVLVFILAILAVFCDYSQVISLPQKISNFFQHHRANTDELINQLKHDYEDKIPLIGFNILNVSISKALNQEYELPIVLLLIGSDEQEETLQSFSHRIGSLIMASQNSQLSPPTVQLNDSHSLARIGQLYEENFIDQKNKVLIFENLQQLSPKVAMAFHQFADDENSRILSTFVVMILKYNQNDYDQIRVNRNTTLRQIERISTQLMDDLWKQHYNRDEMDCLINRLGKYSIVLVN